MEEIGVVKEIVGRKAVVVVQRQSTCEQCAVGSVCKSLSEEGAAIEAVNDANAKVGDRVKISFKSYTYLKGTAFIYGIPAMMLVIGAVIGKEYISRIIKDVNPDLLSGIVGFSLFGLAFLFMRLWLKRFEGKKEYMPVIESIIKSQEQQSSGATGQ